MVEDRYLFLQAKSWVKKASRSVVCTDCKSPFLPYSLLTFLSFLWLTIWLYSRTETGFTSDASVVGHPENVKCEDWQYFSLPKHMTCEFVPVSEPSSSHPSGYRGELIIVVCTSPLLSLTQAHMRTWTGKRNVQALRIQHHVQRTFSIRNTRYPRTTPLQS